MAANNSFNTAPLRSDGLAACGVQPVNSNVRRLTMTSASTLEKLETAIELRSDSALFAALSEVWSAGADADVVPIFCRLLSCDWHQQHEDIVFELGQIGDARAVEPIFCALNTDFPYLAEWGNLKSFQRKCTWALADIGDMRAKTRLEELSRNSNEVLAGYATGRLDAWERELPRKGAAK